MLTATDPTTTPTEINTEETVIETPEETPGDSDDMSFMFDGEVSPSQEPIDIEPTPEVTPDPPAQPEVTETPAPVTEQPPTQPIPDAVAMELQALKAKQQELDDYITALKANQKEEEKKEPELEDVEFVKTDEDLRLAFDSPAGMNKLLNQIFKAGAAKGRELALQSMPEIAQTEAKSIYDRRSLIRNFYSANPELIPHAEVIKTKAVELASSGSYENYAQLLEATEAAIRKEKGIVKQVPVVPPVIAAKPPQKQPLAFPGGNGGAGRKPSPAALSKAQQDIADLLD